MPSDNFKSLRLTHDYFNAEGMTDENSLTNALLTRPDVLSPVLTHLAGREDRRFPLTFMTEGLGNIKYIEGVEYDYPVIGKLRKPNVALELQGNGYGYTKFRIRFKERLFEKKYVIVNPDGIQARIMAEPVDAETSGYWYTCQLTSPDPEATITASDVVYQLWVSTYAPVAMSGSTGTKSNWAAPSSMRNQISMIRKSYMYEGNVQDRTVIVTFDVNGRKTNLWYDWEEYQYMLQWKEEAEYLLWYSKYNRDENGIIHLHDENGKPIPLGSGILEQIPNKDTYGTLTTAKLKNTIRDVLYGASDAQNMNITLFTGTGGMDAFDQAMKADIAGNQYIKTTPTFVSGSGRQMSLGGFFTSYEHVDGHKITVSKLPLLDHGALALNSPKHPVTGLPAESYKMIFLDTSTYDGEPNVKMVAQKGREMIRFAVAGASIPKGFTGNALRANDVDGSSVHFMKTAGAAIRRASNCMELNLAL